jgi:hypothetical protein
MSVRFLPVLIFSTHEISSKVGTIHPKVIGTQRCSYELQPLLQEDIEVKQKDWECIEQSFFWNIFLINCNQTWTFVCLFDYDKLIFSLSNYCIAFFPWNWILSFFVVISVGCKALIKTFISITSSILCISMNNETFQNLFPKT